jgi:tripartite-type tricarboxylate transporter receptor subunit TctC
MTTLLGSLALLPFATAEDWPTKSITVNVGVAAGGLTDTSTRVVVNEMSKFLGVPILAVNLPGGGGGIAFENTFRAPNDGYTWTVHGTPLRTCGVMELHASAPKDWYVLPTVGYAGAIAVREDSPYKTFPELVEALKKNPGKIPYAASTPSTCWRVAVEIMRVSTGLSARYVPYMGSSPSQVALLSGDVQFVLTGIGEQAPLLRGKKIRCLAVFSDKPYSLKGYGEIPAITDFLPQVKPYLPFIGWSSIAMRSDTPKPIMEKCDDALAKAVKTKAVREYCEKFDAPVIEMVSSEAQKFFQRQSALESWLLYEVGVAKKSPAEFGIPKP